MMKKDSIEEMITVLLEKGNLSLATEVFCFFKPTNEKIVEKLIHALVKVNGLNCAKNILKIKEAAGMKPEFSAWEAEQIIASYLDQKNIPYASFPLDMVRAASKHTIMRFFECALSEEACDRKFIENVYYILKRKSP